MRPFVNGLMATQKMKPCTTINQKWLGQFERVEAINNDVQNWIMIKVPKIENSKREQSRKMFFCTTFYLHFIFSTNCSEQNVLFSLKHKLKTWTILFLVFFFFLINQKWSKTKNVMRRKWPSMCVVVKGHRLEEKCQENATAIKS